MPNYYDPVTGQPVTQTKTYYDPSSGEAVGTSESMRKREATSLTPLEEPRFRAWAKQSGISDVDHPDSYYDYRGLYKELGGKPVPMTPDRHFPDTYKQHGHPTFSVESRYSSGPGDGGRWNGETFVPSRPKRQRPNGGLPMEQGPRAGSPLESAMALGIDAATGVAEGLGGTVGLVADVATMPAREMVAGSRALLHGEGYGGAVRAANDAALSLPVTSTATEAADDFRRTARKAAGADVETGPTGDAVRFVANIATPLPFAKAGEATRAATRAATHEAPVAAHAAALVDAAVTPAEAEMAAAAGRAQNAARTATPRTFDAPSVEKIIGDELTARDARLGREPAPTETSVTFTTAKGSTYEVHPDGTTTRNKSYHPEHGVVDQGPQQRSDTTFYIAKSDAEALGEFQARGAKRAIVVSDDGSYAAVRYADGPSAGQIERRTVVKITKTPQQGMIPVELWRDGRTAHFGNEITEVKGGSTAVVTTPPGGRTGAADSITSGSGGAGGGGTPPSVPVVGSPSGGLPKYAEPSAINLDHLNIDDDAKMQIVKTAHEVGSDLEKAKGAPLTHLEIIDAAKTSEVLRQATSRAETLKRAGIALRTRQHLAALAEGKGVPADFVSTLKVLSSEATRAGRELNAFAIAADPSLATSKEAVVKKLLDIGVATDDIVKAAEGVDFTDSRQVTKFYRQFVKPTLPEIVKEYRYINLLSSPKTHIVNSFSNLIQTTVMRPATRLASGVIDSIGSKLTGAEREYYVSQVPAYYKGVANNVSKASTAALEALRGSAPLTNLDVRHIPTGIGVMRPLQIIPRALEASDVFFRTLVEGGELEALASKAAKNGKAVDATAIARQAADTAREVVFRKELDPSNASGHGKLLSTIDQLTGVVHQLRHIPTVNWFIPFVETPMNIFKQGIEYSPAGFATLPGAANKTEQLAKAMIGSTVFAGAASLAWEGRSTWSPPRSPKDRAAFYQAGMQPYAIKIGNKWVSYTKIGPLAYPIAMAAAMRFATVDDPKAAVRSNTAKAARTLAGIAEFFSDQSYVEGLGNLISATRGDEGALTNVATTFPVQLVPLSSLQRWVTQIVDPIYRKADRDLSVNAIIENIKKGIPGLSTSVPPQLTPDGEPSVRQFPVLNAFSPLGISEERPDAAQKWRERMNDARKRALDKAGVEPPVDAARQKYLEKLMTYPKIAGKEFPSGERDENDSMFLKRTGADGKPLRFAQSAGPLPNKLLPDRFANARDVTWGSPLNGILEGNPNENGLYGVEFDPAKLPQRASANTVSIAKSGTEEPEIYAHEVGHAMYVKDFTEEQRTTWKREFVRNVNSFMTEAHGAASPEASKQIARKYPLAILRYAGEYNNDRERAYNEGFAETFGQYMLNPSAFKLKHPKTYEVMRQLVGTEFNKSQRRSTVN